MSGKPNAGRMEFPLGGMATCLAAFFTNPLEVAKTRMQLQGELRAKGQYTRHYRHVFHAFYAIGKYDGLAALQKGLVPALWYQFFMNGVRLGFYQWLGNQGLTRDDAGDVSLVRSVAAGAVSGAMGAVVGSPFYMVKTHLQAKSVEAIAVGHQHTHKGLTSAFTSIYGRHGVAGLWRGVEAAVLRVMVGSAAQLSSFSVAKHKLEQFQFFSDHETLLPICASVIGGTVLVLAMTPLDVVSTRLYNQATDSKGRGVLYRSVGDCFMKIFRTEGFWGFYKGFGPSLFRTGPHTILSLTFWDLLRQKYIRFAHENPE